MKDQLIKGLKNTKKEKLTVYRKRINEGALKTQTLSLNNRNNRT